MGYCQSNSTVCALTNRVLVYRIWTTHVIQLMPLVIWVHKWQEIVTVTSDFFLVPIAHCQLWSLTWLQYWNGGVSHEFWWHNHAWDCAVLLLNLREWSQCAMCYRDWKLWNNCTSQRCESIIGTTHLSLQLTPLWHPGHLLWKFKFEMKIRHLFWQNKICCT